MGSGACWSFAPYPGSWHNLVGKLAPSANTIPSDSVSPAGQLSRAGQHSRRIVDVDFSGVLDEAQFSKLVHEEIDPGPRGADQLGQPLLRRLDEHHLRLLPAPQRPEHYW